MRSPTAGWTHALGRPVRRPRGAGRGARAAPSARPRSRSAPAARSARSACSTGCAPRSGRAAAAAARRRGGRGRRRAAGSGADWLLLDEGAGPRGRRGRCRACCGVRGLGRLSARARHRRASSSRGSGCGTCCAAIARDRSAVRLHLRRRHRAVDAHARPGRRRLRRGRDARGGRAAPAPQDVRDVELIPLGRARRRVRGSRLVAQPPSVLGARLDERVLGDELAVCVVHPRDVVLELVALDPPLPPAADLDRRAAPGCGPARRPATSEMFRTSATSARVRKRVGGHGGDGSFGSRSRSAHAAECGTVAQPTGPVVPHDRRGDSAADPHVRRCVADAAVAAPSPAAAADRDAELARPAARARRGARARRRSLLGAQRRLAAPSDTHPARRGHPRPRRRHRPARRRPARSRRCSCPSDGAACYLTPVDDARRQAARPRAVARASWCPAAPSPRSRARTTVTVPLAAGAAPDLRTGQRIEVWVSTHVVRVGGAAPRRHRAGGARRQRRLVRHRRRRAGRRHQRRPGRWPTGSSPRWRSTTAQLRAGVLVGGRRVRAPARPCRPPALPRPRRRAPRRPPADEAAGPLRRRRRRAGRSGWSRRSTAARTPVEIVRRCVDVVDLLAVAASGQGRAALRRGRPAPARRRRRRPAASPRRSSPVGVVPRGDAAAEERLRAVGHRARRARRRRARVVASVLAEAVRAVGAGPSRRAVRAPLRTLRRPVDLDGDPARRRARPAPADEPARRGSVIAVWGPTGAPGRTTVAVTLADELARLGAASAARRRRRLRRHGRGGARPARRVARAGRRVPAGAAAAPRRRRAGRAVLAARPAAAGADRHPARLALAGAAPAGDRAGAGRGARARRLHRRRLRLLPGDRRGAVLRHARAAAQRRDAGRARRRRPDRSSSARPTRSGCSGWCAGWPSCATPRSRAPVWVVLNRVRARRRAGRPGGRAARGARALRRPRAGGAAARRPRGRSTPRSPPAGCSASRSPAQPAAAGGRRARRRRWPGVPAPRPAPSPARRSTRRRPSPLSWRRRSATGRALVVQGERRGGGGRDRTDVRRPTSRSCTARPAPRRSTSAGWRSSRRRRRGFDYDRLVRLLEERISLAPRYRQKVRIVPGHLANPVWVDDPDFDITYHVRRSALPRPGTDAQLLEFCARIQSRPLDRSGRCGRCTSSRGWPTAGSRS